jgi:hypothetical protein
LAEVITELDQIKKTTLSAFNDRLKDVGLPALSWNLPLRYDLYAEPEVVADAAVR